MFGGGGQSAALSPRSEKVAGLNPRKGKKQHKTEGWMEGWVVGGTEIPRREVSTVTAAVMTVSGGGKTKVECFGVFF